LSKEQGVKTQGNINWQYPGATPATQYSLDTSVNPVTIYMLPVNGNSSISQGSRDMVTARPESGLFGICRHSAPQYEFKDWLDQSVIPVQTINGNLWKDNLVASFAGARDNTGTLAIGRSTVAYGTISFVDDEWESTILNFSGVVGSFRFETWQCVEHIPSATSGYYDLAVKVTTAKPELNQRISANAANAPLANTSNQFNKLPSNKELDG